MKKTIKSSKWFGPDRSLEISLYEYGMAWTKNKWGNYVFVYGVWFDKKFTSFSSAELSPAKIHELLDEPWVEQDFYDHIGMNKERILMNYSLVGLVYDLFAYYGYQNVFGENYFEPFKIKIK